MKEFSDKYHSLLFGDFKSLNLTRISEIDDFYNKQIVDSVFPATDISLVKEIFDRSSLHVDIGFGGGFPLLPLAKLYPNKSFIGLEARRKKSEAVMKISESLDLKNVCTHHHRIEDVLINEDCSLSLKAVGKVDSFLRKINCLRETKIIVIFYKGPNVLDLEKLPEEVSFFSKKLFIPYSLPSGEKRHIVTYESKNVPRRTKKDLVNLTELH